MLATLVLGIQTQTHQLELTATKINTITASQPPPNFDTQVLQPLEAIQAQEAAAAAKAAQEALERRIQAVSNRVQPTGTYSSNYTPLNCTWYVASRISVPDSMGNAANWGYVLGSNSQPLVGAIAWTTAGWAGHVAVVEQVEGDAVEVSEMNYDGLGVIDDRWTAASDWSGFLY